MSDDKEDQDAKRQEELRKKCEYQRAYEAKNKSDWRLSPGKINIHFSNVISFDLYADMSINELRDYVRGKIKDFVD